MPEPKLAQLGDYRYLPGVFQYSRGVAAQPGFAIHRVVFDRIPSLRQGFDVIAEYLQARQRPLQAFCHCELRSPAPFSDDEFRGFNLQYTEILRAWNIINGDDNPVARSNLCPRRSPPSEPCMYAFSYTMPVVNSVSKKDATASFVISGCGEVPEGKPNYRDYIVRRGEQSASAMVEKADYVLTEQTRRLNELGFDWPDVTVSNVYTIHHLTPSVLHEIQRHGADARGFTWHDCRPPVVDIEFEMDCRRVTEELEN